jgi:hypothetical protein
MLLWQNSLEFCQSFIQFKIKVMASEYDDIIKENLQMVLPVAFSIILGIHDEMTPLPIEISKTISRKPDLLFEVKSERPYLLQVEFQSKNDKKMHSRMLLYTALLFDKFQMPIKQVVIYLGKDDITMKSEIQMLDYSFKYDLVNLFSYKYQDFLKNDQPEAIIFAILGNLGNSEPKEVIKKILNKLKKKLSSEIELKKYALQLQTLSKLRNFNIIILNYILDMPLILKKENDPIYKMGKKEGKKESIKTMYKNGMSTTDISKFLNLSEIIVKEYLELA